MEFPFGHHHHHHHTHQRHNPNDDEDRQSPRPTEDYYPPPQSDPPPPFYGEAPDQYPPPPPPPSYGGGPDQYPPPNYYSSQQDSYYTPPPPAASAQHVSHVTEVSEATTHHSYRPHLPEFLHHHEGGYGLSAEPTNDAAVGAGGVIGVLGDLAKKPTMKVYCKAEPNYCLTIRESKVILARSDPNDAYQHWYKDEKYSTRVKDEEGCPCFSLVNKATGEAMKHSVGASHPVQLIPYSTEKLDESILWTESSDLGDSYRAVRMVNNVRLNLDAFHGDRKSGGVHDGTTIVLWQWNKGDNQRWRIVPYCKFVLMTYKCCSTSALHALMVS